MRMGAMATGWGSRASHHRATERQFPTPFFSGFAVAHGRLIPAFMIL